jgi:hypothetical protein
MSRILAYSKILSCHLNVETEENHEETCDIQKVAKRFGRGMAQAVSRRLLTAEARVSSQGSPFWICVGQSGTGTGFSPSASVYPRQYPIVSPHRTNKTRASRLHKLARFLD